MAALRPSWEERARLCTRRKKRANRHASSLLRAETAKGKAKVVDAFLATDGATMRVARSRLHNIMLPACGVYCKPLARWVSTATAAALDRHMQTTPPPAALTELASRVNSAALRRHVGGALVTAPITTFATCTPDAVASTPNIKRSLAHAEASARVATPAAPAARRVAPQPAADAGPAPQRIAPVACAPAAVASAGVAEGAAAPAPQRRRIAPVAEAASDPPGEAARRACTDPADKGAGFDPAAVGIAPVVAAKRSAASLASEDTCVDGTGGGDDPPHAKVPRTSLGAEECGKGAMRERPHEGAGAPESALDSATVVADDAA